MLHPNWANGSGRIRTLMRDQQGKWRAAQDPEGSHLDFEFERLDQVD
jgi:hypothetical protein